MIQEQPDDPKREQAAYEADLANRPRCEHCDAPLEVDADGTFPELCDDCDALPKCDDCGEPIELVFELDGRGLCSSCVGDELDRQRDTESGEDW